MSAEQPWQVLATCPHCRVEAALLQLMDPVHPASHLGRPVQELCRLCGWQTLAAEEPFAPRHAHRAGRCPACNKSLSEAARTGRGVCQHCGYGPRLRETRPPTFMTSAGIARDALHRWAVEEGEPDLDQFCQAHMGLSADAVVDALMDRQTVTTSFDVIAYLFPGAGGFGGAARSEGAGPAISAAAPAEPLPTALPGSEQPGVRPAMDPRTPARVLISVMVADGELRPGERRFIENFLRAEGLDGPSEEDLRIWRPHELGTPPEMELRERIVEASVHLMHLDRQRDGSEWKVVRAFAGAWGISDATLEGWDKAYDQRYATTMTRLWTSLSAFVRLR